MASVLIRDRREGSGRRDHGKSEAKIRVVQPQATVSSTREGGFSLGASGDCGPENSLISDFWPLEVKGYNSFVLSHQVCDHLLQQP